MRTKRFLSIVLTLAILLGMFPGMSLTASAADTTTEITPSNTSGTMTITLTIKAAQTITASDVTATYGDTDKSVSASVTTPTTGGGAISYAVKDGSGDYIDVASDGKLTIKKVPSDGKAYVTVTAAATDDYAAATKDVTVNINTKAMTVSAENVTATVDGQPHGITVNVTDPASGATVKYGTEEGSYTLDASPTQTEAGTKTVYYQVTADNYTTYNGSATVTVSAKQTQTITASDVNATYGDTDKKIEATTTSGGGALSYAVKSGDAVNVDDSGNLTIVKAGSAVITVTAAENDTYASATKDVNVMVNTKSMTVSAEDVNVTVDGQPHGITVNVTDPASGATVKYGTEEGSYTLDASPTQTEVGEKTVYYQVTADNYTTYTGNAKVTVNAKQTQAITADNVTVTYGDTGKKVTATTNGDGAISYAVKDGSADYIDVDASTGALTIKKVGTATVIVTAAETSTYTQATKEVTVTINKANAVAATVTANNRTYDGTEKTLVTVTCEAIGGTMQYALGTETEATQPYTTSIPTGTNAGTYYVWYKVVGDENHNDTEPASVTASIGAKSISDAVVTLSASQLTYNSSSQSVSVTGVSLGGTALASDDYEVSGNTSGTNKGTYTIKVTGKGNYKDEATATWQIVEKAMTVTADNVNVAYDGNEYGITVSVTDPASGTTVRYGETEGKYDLNESPKYKNAGTYPVYFEVSGNSNYDDYTGSATVTISKKAVTAVVSAADKEYDGNVDAAVSAEVATGDIVAGDSIEITGLKGSFADADANDDKEVIIDKSTVVISGTGSDNYEITIPGTAKASIHKASLTVTAKDNTIKYGDTPAGVGVTYKGFKGSDDERSLGGTLSYRFSYARNGKPGTYKGAITPKGLTSNNYDITYVSGNLAVTDVVSKVLAKAKTKGNKALEFTWNKVTGAAKYEVFLAKCGKSKPKKVKTLAASRTSWTKKGRKKKTTYKFYVVAKDKNGNVIGKSLTGHVITGKRKGKYTNAKSLTLKASSAILKEGESFNISAVQKKAVKSKKLLSKGHAALLRYRSENPEVATVNSNGEIKAVSPGWCRVYVQTVNGIWKTLTVTVQ